MGEVDFKVEGFQSIFSFPFFLFATQNSGEGGIIWTDVFFKKGKRNLIQKQPSRGVVSTKRFENMQQIYRRTAMLNWQKRNHMFLHTIDLFLLFLE